MVFQKSRGKMEIKTSQYFANCSVVLSIFLLPISGQGRDSMSQFMTFRNSLISLFIGLLMAAMVTRCWMLLLVLIIVATPYSLLQFEIEKHSWF